MDESFNFIGQEEGDMLSFNMISYHFILSPSWLILFLSGISNFCEKMGRIVL